MKKHLFDGELVDILRHIGTVQCITGENRVLSYDGVVRPMKQLENFLLNMLYDARMGGASWVFTSDEIIRPTDEDYDWDDKKVRLPSVELWYIIPEGKGHDHIRKLWKKHKFDDTAILWDSDFSALYPIFETGTAALQFIEDLDTLFDEVSGIRDYKKKKAWEV